MPRYASLAVILYALVALPTPAAERVTRAEAQRALRKAVEYFRTQVAVEGGYVWRYSEDLSEREGERKANSLQVWVQPPGTPSVGLAILGAYRATGDRYYLETAVETGYCLTRGQLRSGGWDYSILFAPEHRKKYAYRLDPPVTSQKPLKNTTTLDDNNTQAALRFLIELDQALDFKDRKIHDAVTYGLNALLAVQYPNGAWPQRFSEPPDAAQFPVKQAEYPAAWSRTFPDVDYRLYYTFNDNTMADTITTMLVAAETYGEPRYWTAVEKAGDFVLLAQMPEPQPAWAQQYDAQMQPAWARKFEPPAVTGCESQGAMRILLHLYCETGNKKYLKPIPAALAYLKRSALPDGQLARFYELKTNRPLYFTKDYVLTYDDGDMPTHYSFKVPSKLDDIEQKYQRLRDADPKELKSIEKRSGKAKALAPAVVKVIAAQDAQGRWVEEGRLRAHGSDDPTRRVLDSRSFIANIKLLSDYCAAEK